MKPGSGTLRVPKIEERHGVLLLDRLVLKTLLLVPVAVPMLLWWTLRGNGAMTQGDLALTTWLLFGGQLTALPLLLFAAGARRLPLKPRCGSVAAAHRGFESRQPASEGAVG